MKHMDSDLTVDETCNKWRMHRLTIQPGRSEIIGQVGIRAYTAPFFGQVLRQVPMRLVTRVHQPSYLTQLVQDKRVILIQ